MELFAVILAGGVGTRFWPLSRGKNPKQFLPIVSDKTMIEETVHRLAPLIPPGNIVTISSAEQAGTINNLLPSLSEQNILIEPQGKNTAPSLLLATASIYLHNPKAVVAALPADRERRPLHRRAPLSLSVFPLPFRPPDTDTSNSPTRGFLSCKTKSSTPSKSSRRSRTKSRHKTS